MRSSKNEVPVIRENRNTGGGGVGENIVFVHGNASTHATWNGVIAAMAPEFRCIRDDLPGHGRYGHSAEDLDFDVMVEDLGRVITASGARRPNLVGHSLGGFIAARYARDNPNHVRSLCLMATPLQRTAADLDNIAHFLQKVARNGLHATMADMVHGWYTQGFAADHPDALQRRLDQFRNMDVEVFLKAYSIYARKDLEPNFNALQMPVLLLSGQFARGVPTDALLEAAERFENVDCRLYEGMKNGILTEIPGRVAGDLAAFLKDV